MLWKERHRNVEDSPHIKGFVKAQAVHTLLLPFRDCLSGSTSLYFFLTNVARELGRCFEGL